MVILRARAAARRSRLWPGSWPPACHTESTGIAFAARELVDDPLRKHPTGSAIRSVPPSLTAEVGMEESRHEPGQPWSEKEAAAEAWRARREAAWGARDGRAATGGWGASGDAARLPADGEGHRPAGGGGVRLWPARRLVEGAPTGGGPGPALRGGCDPLRRSAGWPGGDGAAARVPGGRRDRGATGSSGRRRGRVGRARGGRAAVGVGDRPGAGRRVLADGGRVRRPGVAAVRVRLRPAQARAAGAAGLQPPWRLGQGRVPHRRAPPPPPPPPP